jgi:DNA-binding transcriptional regulator YdaS (Cro superfamily)
MRDAGLELAIKAAGGVGSLARGLGIAQPSVSAWSRIPAKRVLAVEAMTQVDRFVLRPDLYGSFKDHATSKSEVDEINRLRAAEYCLLSRLLGKAPDADALSEPGIAHVEFASTAAARWMEKSRIHEERLKEAIVAELKRQAADDPQSLSIDFSEDLVVRGKIDLDDLAMVIAGAVAGGR